MKPLSQFEIDAREEMEGARTIRRCGMVLLLGVLALGLGFVVLAWTGCAATVSPGVPVVREASWDGNEQNSGLVGFAADGSAIITPRARDRYNELVARFGGGFAPALRADQGVWRTETNTFVMDAEGLEHFATMNRWRREGKP